MPIVVIILITTISIILLSQGGTPSSQKVAGASSSPTSRARLTTTVTVTTSPTEIMKAISPTDSPFSSSRENITWQYPGSTRIDLGGGAFYYQSSDNPAVITEWYKEKISEIKLNVQTFVANNLNGNIENKLQASNGKTFVSVVIEKKQGDTSTKISVKITE